MLAMRERCQNIRYIATGRVWACAAEDWVPMMTPFHTTGHMNTGPLSDSGGLGV